jgi:hypothetical protein
MLDFQLFSGSMTTSVLTAMAVVQGDHRVKIKGSPRLVAIGVKGANLQYVMITSPGLPAQGLFVPVNENPQLFLSGSLDPNDPLVVSGFQDSGGAEVDQCGILLGYEGKNPLRGGKPCGQRVTVTDGNVLFGTGGPLVNLDASKRYQILGFTVVGTTPIAVRFTHTDFGPYRPGGMAIATDVKQNARWQFPTDDLPEFSGGSVLNVEGMGAGNSLAVDIQLVEVGTGIAVPSVAQGQ